MGDEQQTTMGAGPRKPMEDQTYTVQQLVEFEVVTGWPEQGDKPATERRGFWVDIKTNDGDTITVPPRTLRKTVVEQVLKDAEIVPAVGETMQVRVLDAEAAKPFTIGSVQPPPQLVIEGA